MSQTIPKSIPNAIPIGVKSLLTIARFSDHGAYLAMPESSPESNAKSTLRNSTSKSSRPTPSTSPLHEVLLPKKFCPQGAQKGQSLEVFIYTDSLDRPVATTQTPLAQLGEIAALVVVSHSDHGVFLDLGLEKDIFMPTKSPTRYELGSLVVVRLGLDRAGRLIAKKDIESTLKPYKPRKKSGLYRGQKVAILPYSLSALGLSCVVENRYYGLLYAPRSLQTPESKQTAESRRAPCELDSSTKAAQAYFARAGFVLGRHGHAFIHNIRADGKLDLTPSSAKDTQSDEQKILAALEQHGGSLALHYDSSPESIQALLGISKKSLKRALTKLLAQKRITLTPGIGIRLA